MTNNLFLNFSEIDEILEAALNNAHSYLSNFRNDAGYTQKLETAFGTGFDRAVANQLFDKFAQGNFSDIPSIEIVNRHGINGANGAFSITTGKIYLAADFISQNAQNIQAIVAVLLEEIGHLVDARINTTDAAGDEGDIFARLVSGESLSESELAVLQTEDDTATVTLDGQVVEIEQNNRVIKVTNNNDSGSGSLREAIIEASKTPGVDTIDLTGVSGTINLNSSLPTLNAGNDIIFVDDGNTTISGQNTRQIITVNGANVTFSKLAFANGLAIGGDGKNGGGGGLGAGGALFINAGNVTVNYVKFLNNQAVGGSGIELLRTGGHLYQNGKSGGQGGGFNVTAEYKINAGGLGGSAGQGWTGNRANNGGNGGDGDFGTGGGAGGGGVGGWGGDGVDYAGNGGNGGQGGFGGGGGGGGGGGEDYDVTTSPEHGSGGGGGKGGQFAGNGYQPHSPNTGVGGGGAGLGGAIFVNSGASLTVVDGISTDFIDNSFKGTFIDNSAKGGRGGGLQDGKGLGKDIFVRNGARFQYQGSRDNDGLALDLLDIYNANDTSPNTRGSYTLDGLDGDDTIYAVAGVSNNPNLTKTLTGGKGADKFLLNLKGEVKLAFNFNTQKLADFVNAVTIDPSASDVNWGGFLGDLCLDLLGAGAGSVVGSIFSTGRKIGDLLGGSEAAVAAIKAQHERAKNAVGEFGTQNWGEIIQQGNREKIVITDFQPGLDTLVLPSLLGAKDKEYSYSLDNGSSLSGINILVNYKDSSGQNRSELFATLSNSLRDFGIDDATFVKLVEDLRVTDANKKFTGTISTFKRTPSLGSDNADTIDTIDKSSFASDRIESFGGADRVLGLLGNDIIEGGSGNDTLFGGFDINNSSQGYRNKYQPLINFYGNDGDDYLDGGEGNDILYGESGNDILYGGIGNDELWGGKGSDVFLYDSLSYTGTDTIKDFSSQEGDKILISESDFTGVIDKTKFFSYNTATNTLVYNGKNIAVLNANSGFNIQRDLIIKAAEIFEHGNYQGKSLTLAPGKYDVNDLINNGFGDNILSSLKLPNGWSVRLYHEPGFTGANKVYTSNTWYTGDNWNYNDNVSSLVVSDGYAEVFEHGNYGGQSFKLAPGEYNFNHFANYSFRPESISSLIIPDGWKITLYSSPYENTSRTISSKVFNSSDSWLGDDGWNDRAYSLKVEAPQPVRALALTNGTTTGTTGTSPTGITGTSPTGTTGTSPTGTTGTSGNDRLVGGSGNDTLLGLGGQDNLTGGLGADRFRFNSPSEGMDTITDFSRTQGDKIELFAPGFNNMVWADGVSNALNPSVFSVGTSANSWTNSIIYNNSNGIVYFDPDALGSAPQIALAQLSPGLNLTNQDFIVSWSDSTSPTGTTGTSPTGTTGTSPTGTTGTSPTGTTGTSGNDRLVGGSGNDTLLGLGGQDTLTGGLGADRFRFNSPSEGMDTITDFSRTQGDKIELFAPGFKNMVWADGTPSQALASNVFSMGSSSNSWTNTIIYNNSNGIVYFDSDALGSASQIALAQLSPGLNLTNQDFIVSWN